MRRRLIILAILLTSCGTATPPATPVPIRIEYTFSAQPWLADVYNCAGNNIVIAEQRAADYLEPQMDLAIRIGEPMNLSTPAYQIGTEEILVVLNRITSITHLSAEQVKGLFRGQITNWNQIDQTKNGEVQVWVFPPDEDVQQVFQQTALAGTMVTSTARLATSPDEMSLAVAADQNAVGILPRHWKMGNVTEAYIAASTPVLAITPFTSTEAVQTLLTCLQK